MRHIYHYFARIPNDYGGEYLLDGLLDMSSPILTKDDYRKVKELLLQAKSLNHIKAESVTIKSLTLLQTIED